MNKILAAVDLQDDSTAIAEKALEIAVKFMAELHLIHVVSPVGQYIGSTITDPMGSLEPVMIPNEYEIIANRQRAAEEQLVKIAGTLQGANIVTKVLAGDVEDEILNYAREIAAGMIVMGTHQHGGLFRFLNGETSVNILHETTVPILIVPTHKK